MGPDRRTTFVVRLGLVVAGLLLAGSVGTACTSGDEPSGERGGSTPATVPPQSLPEASADATAVVESANLAIDDDVARCVAGRLDESPDLRDDLGPELRASPRFGELLALVDSCRLEVAWATQFAEAVQDSSGGRLSAEQLACVRDTAAGWPPEEVSALVAGGAFPSNDPGQSSTDVAASLKAACGLDLGEFGAALQP